MSTRPSDHDALRVVRGGLLATASAALAVSAHALADGGIPDAASVLLLTALIGWTATALTAKARGRLGTLMVLGAGQLVMHTVLSTLMTHGEPHPGGGLSGMTMFATHAVATIVTAGLVAKADAMILSVANGLRLLLPVRRLPAAIPAAGTLPASGFPPVSGHLITVVFRHVLARRGPPQFS